MRRKPIALLLSGIAAIGLSVSALAADTVTVPKEALPHAKPVFAVTPAAPTSAETGKQIAFSRKHGNCLACHAFPNVQAQMPGSIAPPLVAMKLRYPNKSVLRARIWNEMKFNPNTAMPPFGKHKILTKEEIDKVVDFLYTL